VAWRRVAGSVAAGDEGIDDVEAAAVDPATGALWVVRTSGLVRLDSADGHLSTMARPSPFGRVIAARVTLDGALWLSDGVALARVGHAGEPPGYADQVKAFSVANCDRCHSATAAVARLRLDTYADWSRNVDAIIAALDQARMPSDRRPLVGGTVELIRAWRDGGLRR
jgi:hypothetical protein